MALHFPKVPATFLHIPKNGGSSLIRWADEQYAEQTVKSKLELHNVAELSEYWNLGQVFTFVRNPFDRLVSMYHFWGQSAERRLALINNNPAILAHKDYAKFKGNFEQDLKQYEIYKQGFHNWVMSDTESPNSVSKKDNQVSWFSGTDPIIIKLENLQTDFRKIQKLLNCYDSLPHVNKSKHNDYRSYYNSESIKRVEEICKADLDRFNYDF